MNQSQLNEYLPLKQGLRPLILSVSKMDELLNEYLPLKQGLRQERPHHQCK